MTMNLKSASLQGRLLSGLESDHGTRVHALDHDQDHRKALCGSKPGRKSVGWAYDGDAVSCPRCLKKLQKLGVSL